MLDFGFSEILLTSAIALVVLGPGAAAQSCPPGGQLDGPRRV